MSDATPLLRFGTDSHGRRRPKCQDVRSKKVSAYRPAGEPCGRWATQRSPAGLWVCPTHGEQKRRHLTPEEELRLPLDARLQELRVMAIEREIHNEKARAEKAEAEALATRCKGCGCTKATPCVLRLVDGAGLGLCAHAGLEPWLRRCSGCLTPELRTDAAAWKESA